MKKRRLVRVGGNCKSKGVEIARCHQLFYIRENLSHEHWLIHGFALSRKMPRLVHQQRVHWAGSGVTAQADMEMRLHMGRMDDLQQLTAFDVALLIMLVLQSDEYLVFIKYAQLSITEIVATIRALEFYLGCWCQIWLVFICKITNQLHRMVTNGEQAAPCCGVPGLPNPVTF